MDKYKIDWSRHVRDMIHRFKTRPYVIKTKKRGQRFNDYEYHNPDYEKITSNPVNEFSQSFRTPPEKFGPVPQLIEPDAEVSEEELETIESALPDSDRQNLPAESFPKEIDAERGFDQPQDSSILKPGIEKDTRGLETDGMTKENLLDNGCPDVEKRGDDIGTVESHGLELEDLNSLELAVQDEIRDNRGLEREIDLKGELFFESPIETSDEVIPEGYGDFVRNNIGKCGPGELYKRI